MQKMTACACRCGPQGHGLVGSAGGSGWMDLEVCSNLDDSVILWLPQAIPVKQPQKNKQNSALQVLGYGMSLKKYPDKNGDLARGYLEQN